MPPRHRQTTEFKQALARFKDQKWRLNNLYNIVNDEGFVVPFQMNEAQEWLYDNLHTYNIILKSRQLGFTTFIDLYFLDKLIFNSNTEALIIAHKIDDAMKFMRRKIRFPYTHLPEAIKQKVKIKKDSEGEIIFSNGSSIGVATSARSGSYQLLHISEFAKICAKEPEKAREIVTGSIETLAPGMELFIESTAEGRHGYFYDYCKMAKDRELLKQPLNKQEFKFHFFGWYLKEANRLPASDDVVFPTHLQEYFEHLEAQEGVKLDRDQKFWYMNKVNTLGELVKREHPSTPEEAFEESIKGAYFAREFDKIRMEKRITRVPVEEGAEVHTAWDLGMHDSTAIWFFQKIGKEIRLVDYYENHGEGLGFYRDILEEKGYRYGKHLAPHDISVRELGSGKSRLEIAENLGIKFTIIPKVGNKQDSIQAARNLLNICWFDQEKTDEGIKHLESYRKQWNDRLGTWKDAPLRDEHTHGADAFQTLALGYDTTSPKKIVKATSADRRKRWKAAVGM